MAYQVIARKFRPQSFDEFVGQEHVTQTLLNAMESDRFPHAILLNGPRGTGKTTTARIIAKTLLCQSTDKPKPCGECQSCKDLVDGNHLDVIEIDGASNNGVDHIRELRDTVGYMPASGSHKIYIIDEVHMLSTSAFNALLKTLEEPPEHVVFIFATTEVQKIPATILSRCQRFDFRNHSLSDIKNHLASICEKEGVEFEEAALWSIAKQARGSIRDSLTLLDQMITFGAKKLTLDGVMGALGLTDRNLLLKVLSAVADGAQDDLLAAVNGFKESGIDSFLFAEELLEVLRNALLVKLKCHQKTQMDISEFEVEELERITEKLAEPEIHLLFDVTLSGVQRLNYSRDPHLALEMLLFKLLNLPRLTKEKSFGLVHGTPKGMPGTKPNAEKKTPARPSAPEPAVKAEVKETEEAKPAATKNLGLTEEIKAPEKKKASVAVPLPNPAQEVGKTWEEFVLAVKQANGFLGALLEHTSIFKQDEKVIALGLPSKMSFLMDKLAEPKNIERTENFLQAFWNDHRKIEVEILTKNHTHENLSPKAMEEQARKTKAKKEADSIESHPLVQAAEKVFKDNITQVGVHNTPPPRT